MYVGGTTLLTGAYTECEKTSVQGLDDLIIFSTTSVTAVASGFFLTAGGWALLNSVTLPLLAPVFVAAFLLARHRRLLEN